MRDIALISRKIYTAGTNFTRPPVVTVATNLNSAKGFKRKSTSLLAGNFNLVADTCEGIRTQKSDLGLKKDAKGFWFGHLGYF